MLWCIDFALYAREYIDFALHAREYTDLAQYARKYIDFGHHARDLFWPYFFIEDSKKIERMHCVHMLCYRGSPFVYKIASQAWKCNHYTRFSLISLPALRILTQPNMPKRNCANHM